MSKREEKPKRQPDRGNQEPGEELDALNADLTAKRGSVQALRRRMEAQIERKAKVKRSREVAASANYKRRA